MQGTHGSNTDPTLSPNAKGSVEADEPSMQGTHGSNVNPTLSPNAKGSVEADNTIYDLSKLKKNTAGFTKYTKQLVLSVFGRIYRPTYLARVFQS